MGRGPSIEGRKNAADAQKAKLFTKFIREITIAARLGGADPAGNARLRIAIDKALDANMTKDTIERATKRGAGAGDGADMHEIRYEGYGPGGVAVMVDCLTDNQTRTVAEVRHGFSKFGGNMGTSGSVAFQFTETGELWFKTGEDAALEEKLLEAAIEAGADDVQNDEGYSEVLTAPGSFESVKKSLEAAGFKAIQAEVVMRAGTRVALTGEAAEQFSKMLHMLEDLDDVQNVHHNADLPSD
jgi:YebC/PmpR family DNA-binding regulatory protein